MLESDSRLNLVAAEAGSVPFHIIRTKLVPAQPRRGVIPRPRLVERLDQGLEQPLTLVHAAAGSGKSTLVQQWLGRPGVPPAAWVWLDQDDNELIRFVTYIVSAVQSVFPGSCQQTRALLLLPATVPVSLLTSTFLNELGDLPGPLVLVLEEYETIRSETVHQWLSQMVEYQPPALHLVVVTRLAPPLALARLRQRRLVNEIRGDDLRLSIGETAAILEAAAGSRVNDETAASLHVQTEGWVGGLHLTAMADNGEQLIREFFLEEVLAAQPPDVQQFLLESSLPERFCPALMANLSPKTATVAAAEKMVQGLQWASLFVNVLSSPAGFYRYHGLFREALRWELAQRRDRDEIAEMHRITARWFEDEGEIELALTHWLAAGEQEAAAESIERHVAEAMAGERFTAIAGWLKRLPSELIRQRPALLLADVCVRQARMFLPDVEPQLDQVDNHPDKGNDPASRAVKAWAAALCSNLYYWRGNPARSQAAAQQAFEVDIAADAFTRAYALARLALSQQMSGKTEETRRQLDAALHEPGLAAGAQAQLLRARALAELRGANLELAERSALALLRLAQQHLLPASTSWAHYLLGRIYYEWNRLEKASGHFSAVVQAPTAAASLPLHESHVGLALIYQIRGEQEVADKLLTGVQERFQERGALFLPSTAACEAHLALLRGDVLDAARVVNQRGFAREVDNLLLLETPKLTRIRVLIAQKTEASLQQAMDELRVLQRVTLKTYNRLRHVEVLALRGLVLEAQGEIETALDAIQQAVAVAGRGGMVRAFVDLGPPMAALLYRLANSNCEIPYARQLLASFPRLPQPAMQARADEADGVLQPLTDREWEVLALMGQRLSNKEIAQDLIVSPHTVKKHASNIYQKLDVNSRRQAIARAYQLGLLSRSDDGSLYRAFT